jgi:hypothetical protein
MANPFSGIMIHSIILSSVSPSTTRHNRIYEKLIKAGPEPIETGTEIAYIIG